MGQDDPQLTPGRLRLLIMASSTGRVSGDRFLLDVKFVQGMRFYVAAWEGSVDGVVTDTPSDAPFSAEFAPEDLPFGLRILPAGTLPSAEELARYDVILASGDVKAHLDLAEVCAALPVRLYFVIENILETQLQIIFLDRQASLLRKLQRVLWCVNQHRFRCRAFKVAAGLQANGYPAASAYGKLNRNMLLFLDNRISKNMAATADDLTRRQDRLSAGGRLQLIHSGRLEPIKGAQDLVPIALAMRQAGLEFNLNIFGTGSLLPEIRSGIARHGLESCVTLHGSVDFETVLIPFAREKADLFISCHRQSDPSCTYVETMACGVPIVGYNNRMWSELASQSGGGWVVPLGDVGALSRLVISIAEKRQEIASRGIAAWRFTSGRLFEEEFARRIAQLSGAVASRPDLG